MSPSIILVKYTEIKYNMCEWYYYYGNNVEWFDVMYLSGGIVGVGML